MITCAPLKRFRWMQSEGHAMKSSTLYRWLEWTFQPQTCTEVFPVIGLQENNTEEIYRDLRKPGGF